MTHRHNQFFKPHKLQTVVRNYEITEYDNIYFDVVIEAPDADITGGRAIYNIDRDIPIINDASKYYASIIRFSIPNFYVPVLIMPIQDNQNNVNLSEFSVTLEANGFVFQQFVIFASANTFTTPIPPSQTPNGKQVNTPYYFVFEYQHLVDLVNIALSDALIGLLALTGPIPGAAAPVITFNPVTNLFSIVAQESFYNIFTLGTQIILYFNQPLWILFDGFSAQQHSLSSAFSSDGRDIQILIKDNYFMNLNTPGYNPPFVGDYLVLTQEYKTIFNWNPFKRIVIVSNNLPINSEYINGSGSGTIKILSDYVPSPTDEIRTFWEYNADIYRLIDMISHAQIKEIDLTIYWQDSNEFLYPLFIPWGQQATLKLAFFNKKLYKNFISSTTISN